MDNRMLIDWLTFSIKPDPVSNHPANVSLSMVFNFLHLLQGDFQDIGHRNFYEHAYSYNGITVHEPSSERLCEMGFCVSMTGEGCRYFEGEMKGGEFGVDIWREFFQKLRALTGQGYAVNVSRLDIAVDDFDGLLDLGQIEQAVRNCEIVSCCRKGREIESMEVNFKRGTIRGKGNTIEFGSRSSKTFCRFYDKKIEQMERFSNDSEKLAELEKVPHWVRMEFEFKKQQAIKIVNAICDSEDFGTYYFEVVNSYVRFVELDDVNISRRSMKDWWAKFMGTVDRLRLTVADFKSYGYQKLVKYYDKYLTTTVFTILNQMPIEDFLARTFDMAVSRLRPKHLAIMDGKGRMNTMNNGQLWDALNPILWGRRKEPGCLCV